MAFGFGSKPVEVVAGGVGQPAPALSLFSWEDMCDKGGNTIVFAVAIWFLYVLAKNWIYWSAVRNIAAMEQQAGAPRPSLRATLPAQLFSDDPNASRLHRVLMWAERALVIPFVPAHLDYYIMWIFNVWFVLTIPMAVTRYYESKWMHDVFALQGPLNLISNAFGCGHLNMHAIPYTEQLDSMPSALLKGPPLDGSDKWGRIDWYFANHLVFGTLWLLVGFIQIYQAKPGAWSFDPATNWKVHRNFGRIAVTSISIHIILMIFMTSDNPVNQHPIIVFMYVARIVGSVQNLWLGLKHAFAMTAIDDKDSPEHRAHKEKHKLYMFYLYTRSTMGSGSIRLGAWVLWLVGHFLKPEYRMLIDRGDCQTYAKQGIGDASDCWRPVYINLLLTDFIVTWLELVFLCMSENSSLTELRNRKKEKIEEVVIITVPSLVLVATDHIIDTPLAEFSAIIWAVIISLDHFLKEGSLRRTIKAPFQRRAEEHAHQE